MGKRKHRARVRHRKDAAKAPSNGVRRRKPVGRQTLPGSPEADLPRVNPLFAIPLQLGLLVLATVAVYSGTLSVPFYFDDYGSIVGNPAITDLGNLEAITGFAPQRALVYLSLALNYHWNGLEPAGYHVVNILLHVLTSITAFALVRQILQASSTDPGPAARWLPIFVALLFALHPLQTQAVNYVVQRATLMAGLFYLLTMLCYLTARLTPHAYKRWTFAALAATAALAAVFSKQTVATLPAALVLLEFTLFGISRRKLGLLAAAAIASMVAAGLFLGPTLLQQVSDATRETALVSRLDYLAIQMSVIWAYAGKFFFPFPLQLDYDVALASFASAKTWLLAMSHLAVIILAGWQLRRRPLPAFGILFYYLALAVESSIIPIRDFAFEHRTYLPNLGLCLALSSLLLMGRDRKSIQPLFGVLAALTLVVLSFVSVNRNRLWSDPVSFMEHEIAMSPQLLRPRAMLGEYYLRQGQVKRAIEVYRAHVRPPDGELRMTKAVSTFYRNMIIALASGGLADEALQVFERLPWQDLSAVEQSDFFMLKGKISLRRRQISLAREDFENALRLHDANHDARIGYSRTLILQGQLAEARFQLQRVQKESSDEQFVGLANRLLATIATMSS